MELFSTVILSNFRRTRTILHSISTYPTQTALKYFYNKNRVRGVESNYRTIIKNLELFLKTRVYLKNNHKISQNLVFKNNSKFLIIVQ
jgi:hypothetical protein